MTDTAQLAGNHKEQILCHNVDTCCEHVNGGGTKTVFAINEFLVTARPNLLDGQELIDVWPRIVQDEFTVSKIWDMHDIPHMQLIPSIVAFNYCGIDYTLPSFVAVNFSFLATRGILVVECNSNTPKTVSHIIASLILPQTPQEWAIVIQPLIDDLVNIVRHKIPCSCDSMNLALFVAHNNTISEVRLFGFDFSSKRQPLDPNDASKHDEKGSSSFTPDAQFYEYMLKRRLQTLFKAFTHVTRKSQDVLVDSIVNHYIGLLHCRTKIV